MHIRRVEGPAELAVCLRLRRVVFIDEQGVPEKDELDDLDPVCTHFLALPSADAAIDDAIGTARLWPKAPGMAKVQRVAVLAPHRGRGVGAALMAALEEEAGRQARHVVVLGSQVSAVPFYLRLGYEPEGDVFLDAGIPHQTMKKRLQGA